VPAPIVNGGGDRPWKVQFSELQKPVTLTLTSYRVIRHTVVHHSSTYIYTPNFIEIGKTFCGRMDVPNDRHFRPPLVLLGRLGGVDLITQDLWMDWTWLTGRRMEKLVTSLLSAGLDGPEATQTALTSSLLCKLPWLATLSDRPDSTCIIQHLLYYYYYYYYDYCYY